MACVTPNQPFAAQCEGGNVKLLRGGWNDTYLDEVTAFPSGRHDQSRSLRHFWNAADAELPGPARRMVCGGDHPDAGSDKLAGELSGVGEQRDQAARGPWQRDRVPFARTV